jgi:hypothetical protein
MSSEKMIALLIAVFLLLTSVTLIAMPFKPTIVNAQTSDEIGGMHGTPPGVSGDPHLNITVPPGVTPDYTLYKIAFMSISPDPIGIGQPILVNIWTTPGTHHAFYMVGYKVTLEKPNGDTVVLGPVNSYYGDCTAWFQYVVDQVGTWKAKFESPGTFIPKGVYVDRPGTVGSGNYTLSYSLYYTAASTDWQNFTVQADMVASWRSVPLPTDYWIRPISAENREWYQIGGNYPWSGAIYYPDGRVLVSSNYKYQAWVQAPNTAHVVWRIKGTDSGIIGGGEAYQIALTSGGGNPSIIYNGRCYQSRSIVVNGVQTSVYSCYDLRTGQVYWDRTGISPTPTNIYYEKSTAEAVPGATETQGFSVYLVAISGGRLIKYNPWTMAASANVSLPTGITSGTIYNNEWVFTVQTINATTNNYRLINWSMAGSNTNFTTRIGTNITWPKSSLGNLDFDAGLAVASGLNIYWPPEVESDRQPGAVGYQYVIGYRIETVDLYTGALLVNVSSDDTLNDRSNSQTSIANRGKTAVSTDGRHWSCWDARTGKLAWRSDLTAYPWGNFWAYNTASYDFNESKSAIIGCSYAGIYAIDWDNGHIIWHYSSPMTPFEDPYQTEPFFTGVVIADGKVYGYGGEHSPSQPVTRGWHLHCVNATTGEGIWKITGPMTPGAVADGYLTASDPYDGYMYVFGKGKSATTITAPDTAVAKGTAVVIKGTVMDMSPGDRGSIYNPAQPPDSPTAPGTVPCVSAASMETQMEYLYMQHPIDGLYHNQTITGVPVALTAIKSDGSVIDIGTTTTNGYYGTFGYEWTPPDEGTYTVLASFAGDDSYGSSSAATSLSVGPAIATPSTPEIPTPVDTTMVIIGTGVAIIIAVVIAVAVAVLLLRKRQ